jgi:hypothetical protein
MNLSTSGSRPRRPCRRHSKKGNGNWSSRITCCPGSGIDALTVLKESGLDLPLLIVSGNIGEEIAVAAMKAGAHDYLIKGNLARLAPAVERELREAAERRERRRAEEELERYRYRLEEMVENRTAELEAQHQAPKGPGRGRELGGASPHLCRLQENS